MFSSILKQFSHSCVRIHLFNFFQHFLNDHRNVFYSNCIPENEAVRNIVNWLFSFNSFQATLLLIEMHSQVALTQGCFMKAKAIQWKVSSPFYHVNPTWMFFVFPENHRKWSSSYSQVRAVKPASLHSSLCIRMSHCMWGLSSSSPECLGADMVSQNQAQLRQIFLCQVLAIRRKLNRMFLFWWS